jgi:hypothetical protein
VTNGGGSAAPSKVMLPRLSRDATAAAPERIDQGFMPNLTAHTRCSTGFRAGAALVPPRVIQLLEFTERLAAGQRAARIADTLSTCRGANGASAVGGDIRTPQVAQVNQSQGSIA